MMHVEGYYEYHGGGQYCGRYHPLKFEYCGGYHDTSGGYHEYRGGVQYRGYSNNKRFPPMVLNTLNGTHDILPRAS